MTFADEIKPSVESAWAYICVISVSVNDLKKATMRLQADRDACGQQHEIGWGDMKKPGDHARPGAKEQLATLWLSRLVNEPDIWRFSIMGIDTSHLDLKQFGERRADQITNVYRRFYRANLKLHVSTLHRGRDLVNVVKTYHDEEGRLEADDWFSWHPNAVIGERETVTFAEQNVCFVNSCHLKEKKQPLASHFIQLCDILAGATRYAFEGIGRNAARDRIVKEYLPLVDRLNGSKTCRNINSSYKHVGRATLTFFPSKRLNEEEMNDKFTRDQSTFFRDRPMLLMSKNGRPKNS